jgi:hypothetical protein
MYTSRFKEPLDEFGSIEPNAAVEKSKLGCPPFLAPGLVGDRLDLCTSIHLVEIGRLLVA